MRAALTCTLAALTLAGPALGADALPTPTQCGDDFADCREDCAMEFGTSVQDKVRAKFNKCIKKCQRNERDCRERFFETHRNALDEGALERKKDEPKPVDHDDDLRRDTAPADDADEAPKPKKGSASAAAPKDERPASNEPVLRTDSAAPYRATSAEERAAAKPKPEPAAEKTAEPERDRPPPEKEKPSRPSLDGDLRSEDESQATSGSAPKPAAKSRSSERSRREDGEDDGAKKKKKEPRPLDEWDPDAL